jgi:hypothetical protein
MRFKHSDEVFLMTLITSLLPNDNQFSYCLMHESGEIFSDAASNKALPLVHPRCHKLLPAIHFISATNTGGDIGYQR